MCVSKWKEDDGMKKPLLQAHRGVSTEFPENTVSAIMGAIEQGYPIIEIDPSYTADGVIVLLHDKTLNRTARKQDGSSVGEEKIFLADISYAECQTYDVGLWFDESFRGEKIPLLSEILEIAARHGTHVKIDNKFEAFPEQVMQTLFSICKNSGADIGFTCNSLEFVKLVLKNLPDATIHYDGVMTKEGLEALSALVDREKLVGWLPYPTPHNTWVKIDFVNDMLCALVKQYAKLGLWILSEESEYLDACEKYAPDIIETTGGIKIEKNLL